jgi:hypothetical protein
MKSPLAPETQGLLDFLKSAKLKTPTGEPTVAGQAAMQAGIAQPPVEQEAPPPEQQGIASIMEQAKQAGPTIAQNQQDSQAQQTAQMAAQMMKGQPTQSLAEGGLASLPIEVGYYGDGGVLGYSKGGQTPEEPTAESAAAWMASLSPKQDVAMEAEEKRLYEARKALQAERPDTTAQRTAAMEEAYLKEKAFRPTESAIHSFAAGARGLGGFGESAVQSRKTFAARDAAYNEGAQAQRDVDYAKKTGDIEALNKALGERKAAKEKYDTLSAGIGEKAMMAQASIYGNKMQSADSAANRLVQERIARITADSRPDPSKEYSKQIEDDTEKRLKTYLESDSKFKMALRKNPQLLDEKRQELRKQVIADAIRGGMKPPPGYEASAEPAASPVKRIQLPQP